MATIRNSINLYDRMTPVLRSIMKSMDSTLKAMKEIDKATNKGFASPAIAKAEKDIKKANNQLIKMENYAKKASMGMSDLADSTGKVSNNMSRIQSTGFNLVNLASALYLVRNIKDAIEGLMEAPDEAISTKARLGLFNESMYSTDELYRQIYQTALKTRTGLEETGNLITRILISGAMSGEGSAVGAIKATDLINQALIAGGGTAEENRRALLQLSQGLASGMLQGDELRAIREQTPYMARILAEGMAKIDPKFAGGTIGDLKKWGAEGELTSERILKAFFAMEDEIEDAFKQMPRTFGPGVTQISSVWKYFKTMLAQDEQVLAKVNLLLWKFADFLTSPAGDEFLKSVALGLTVVIDGVLKATELISTAFQWLSSNIHIVQSAFVAFGGVMIITAIYAAAAWTLANWPLIVVAGTIALVAYQLLAMGYTAGEVFGTMVGRVLWFGATVWNAMVAAVTGITFIVLTLWDVVQFIIGLIWNILVVIGLSLLSIGGVIVTVFDGVIFTVISLFGGLATTVLGILLGIAQAIDFIFGSNLSGTVNTWMNKAIGKTEQLMQEHNPANDLKKIGEMWENAPWAESYYIDPYLGINAAQDKGLFLDANKYLEKGQQWGKDIDDYFTDFGFSMNLENYEDLLKNWDPESIEFPGSMYVNGGDLDSVGKIKSDVDISEEDLKLLKDIAAREFLLNMTSIVPQATINFGDIRETADINKILEAMEDMIENAFATSLIAE